MSPQDTLEEPEVQSIRAVAVVDRAVAEAVTFESEITSLVITSNADYESAGALVLDAKGRLKQLEEMRTHLKAPILEAGRRLDALFEKPRTIWTSIVKTLDGKLAIWRTEQERKRREEEARLRQQVEAENKRRLEAADKKAEKLLDRGLADAAQSVLDSAQAAVVPPPVLAAPEIPKVDGLGTRKTWKFRIVDETKIPREYLVPDEKKIGGVVRALKDKTNISGVEVYYEKSSIGRV